jgi:hypothetical protein
VVASAVAKPASTASGALETIAAIDAIKIKAATAERATAQRVRLGGRSSSTEDLILSGLDHPPGYRTHSVEQRGCGPLSGVAKSAVNRQSVRPVTTGSDLRWYTARKASAYRVRTQCRGSFVCVRASSSFLDFARPFRSITSTLDSSRHAHVDALVPTCCRVCHGGEGEGSIGGEFPEEQRLVQVSTSVAKYHSDNSITSKWSSILSQS